MGKRKTKLLDQITVRGCGLLCANATRALTVVSADLPNSCCRSVESGVGCRSYTAV